MVFCLLDSDEQVAVLFLTDARPPPRQHLAVVFGQKLPQKLEIAIVHNQVFVSAEWARISGFYASLNDTLGPGGQVGLAMGEVPTVEFPNLFISIGRFVTG